MRWPVLAVILLLGVPSVGFAEITDNYGFKFNIEPYEGYQENYVKRSDFEYEVGEGGPFVLMLIIENTNPSERILPGISIQLQTSIDNGVFGVPITLDTDVYFGKSGTKESIRYYHIPPRAFEFLKVNQRITEVNTLYKLSEEQSLGQPTQYSYIIREGGERRSYIAHASYKTIGEVGPGGREKVIVGTYDIKIVPSHQLKDTKIVNKAQKWKERTAVFSILIALLSLVGGYIGFKWRKKAKIAGTFMRISIIALSIDLILNIVLYSKPEWLFG